jgi:hypothetical protein
MVLRRASSGWWRAARQAQWMAPVRRMAVRRVPRAERDGWQADGGALRTEHNGPIRPGG